jgi:shikimate 5-dehydrogenase
MRTLGTRGLNVTMPHKQDVIPYLDALDETACEIGAVNTKRPFAHLCVRRHLGSDTAS